jgi:diguanylate cyclase (GGDEF)-like protein
MAAAIFVAYTFGVVRRSNEQVLQSTRLIARVSQVRSEISSAQSSVRGFALTGKQSFLDPYRTALYELARWRDSLDGEWSSYRPEQRARVAQALELFFRWRDEIAEPVIEAHRPPTAETTALLVQGSPLLEEANGLLDGVSRRERDLLRVRMERSDSIARWGGLLAVVASVVAFGYVLVAGYLMTRRTVRAIESISRGARALAGGDLSRRVSLASDDELGAMAHAFNVMAERLGERALQAQRLLELAQLLQVSLTTREVGELFETFVPRLVPATGGRLFLHDAKKQTMDPLAIWGPDQAETFRPSACWALRLGKTYHSSGGDGPICEHGGVRRQVCSLCVPMVVHGETLGLIQYVYDPGEQSPMVMRLGAEVAERFAFTLSNLALRERLRDQSVRDALTGLFNRRYLDEMLEREIERARRSGQQLGVLMIDLDHFKTLNDLDGHETGDAVLREFGSLLLNEFRTGDEAFRYGGEEFVVLLPAAGVDEVLERARGLRERIARLRAVSAGKVVRPVTASMGVSAFPGDGATAAELLRAADEALLVAKRTGRDRVVAAGREARALPAKLD